MSGLSVSSALEGRMAPPAPRPFWLPGAPEPVFAVAHEPAPALRRPVAVLALGPYGWEDVASYRARRIWAQHLAAAGFPVLRLDLPGTGNSAGTPQDPGRLDAWIATAERAAEWCRQQFGASSVTAVGLGLGGVVAYQAAAGGAQIDDFVLWAAPSRGKALVRELHAFGRLQAAQYGSRESALDENVIEAAGFVLSQEAADALKRVDLTALTLPRADQRRALVLDRDGMAFDTRLADHLEAQGTAVTHADGPGWAALNDTPQDVRVPWDVVERVGRWLAEDPSGQPAARASKAVFGEPTAELAFGDAVLRETITQIAQPSGHLVGTWTESAEAPHSDVALIFLNPGAVRRIGPNRLWLESARRWAARGLPSLRLDQTAIGDSDGDDAEVRETRGLYADAFIAPIVTVLDELEALHGARRFILVGLCSSGFAAFATAVRDPRVKAVALLNGELVRETVLESDPDIPTVHNILHGERGRRFLRGEVGPRRVAELAVKTARTALKRPRQMLAGRQRAKRLAASFDLLRDRGQNVALIFSTGKRMHAQLVRQRFLARAPERWPNLAVTVLPGRDHTFRPLAMQRAVSDALDARFAQELVRLGETSG